MFFYININIFNYFYNTYEKKRRTHFIKILKNLQVIINNIKNIIFLYFIKFSNTSGIT